MRLFPNYEPGGEDPITYVQWSENDTDTLQCQVARGDGYTYTTKVWLNGSVLWDVESGNSDFPAERYAEITKTR